MTAGYTKALEHIAKNKRSLSPLLDHFKSGIPFKCIAFKVLEALEVMDGIKTIVTTTHFAQGIA